MSSRKGIGRISFVVFFFFKFTVIPEDRWRYFIQFSGNFLSAEDSWSKSVYISLIVFLCNLSAVTQHLPNLCLTENQ